MENYCELKYIYVLKCPSSGEVRYVGESVHPFERYGQHTNEKADTYKARWINKLKRNNLLPLIEVIDSCPKSMAREKESFWIDFYNSAVVNLTNTGEGNDTRSTQQLRKEALVSHGTIGVWKSKDDKRWICAYYYGSKREYLGSFVNKKAALKHYDNVARYYEKYPVTNFEGSSSYSIETAKKISNKVCRKIKYGCYYPYIHFDKEVQKYKARIKINDDEKGTYISGFNTLDEAILNRDRVAKFYDIETYEYHDAEPLSIEDVQKLNQENNPVIKDLYSGYIGVSFNKNQNCFVCFVVLEDKFSFIGGFKDEEDAKVWHDRVAKYYNLPVNEEPDYTCSMEEVKLLIKKDRSSKTNGLGVIGVSRAGKTGYSTSIMLNREKIYIGCFSSIEEATYYADATRNYYELTNNNTTTDKLSVQEAKLKIALAKTPKGIRFSGQSWIVRITLDKKEYNIGKIETKEQAIYISDALRNYYNLPNSQTTQDKLSLEEARKLV